MNDTRHGGHPMVEMFIKYGINAVFGVPGGQMVSLYDAIRNNNDKIRHITYRDEVNAAYGADAYARISGKVGLCDGTVGCGAVKFISGFIESYNSSIPVIGIVPESNSKWITEKQRGTGSQQSDQKSILRPVTKATMTLTENKRVPEIVSRAFQIATSDRPGPVLIELPVDLMEQEFQGATPEVNTHFGTTPPYRSVADPQSVKAAVDLLYSAKRPVLFAGGGCWSSKAKDAVKAMAEKFNMPVGTSLTGKGILSEDHPLSLGIIGYLGDNSVSRTVIKEADVILTVGMKFGDNSTFGWNWPAKGQKIIQLDIDTSELGKMAPIEIGLTGDAKATLEAMIAAGDSVREDNEIKGYLAGLKEEWAKEVERQCAPTSPLNPQLVTTTVSNVADDNAILVCDASLASGWGARFFSCRGNRRTVFPRGVAGLGFSMGASIGAAVARPDARVFALGGDLALSYSIGEFATMKKNNLNVTVVVLNNSSMSAMKWEYAMRYKGDFYDTSLSDISYVQVAKGFGVPGFFVDDPAQLADALKQAAAVDGPSVVEVRTTDNEQCMSYLDPHPEICNYMNETTNQYF